MLVRDLMTTEVVSASPTMTLKEFDALLTRHVISGAPVLDNGTLVGVVSQSDVVRVLYGAQLDTADVSQYLLSPYPIALGSLNAIARDRAAIADRMVVTKVADVMTGVPVTVAPDEPVSAAARAMCDAGVHRVLVTDGNELVGVVSALDLAGLLVDRA